MNGAMEPQGQKPELLTKPQMDGTQKGENKDRKTFTLPHLTKPLMQLRVCKANETGQ